MVLGGGGRLGGWVEVKLNDYLKPRYVKTNNNVKSCDILKRQLGLSAQDRCVDEGQTCVCKRILLGGLVFC